MSSTSFNLVLSCSCSVFLTFSLTFSRALALSTTGVSDFFPGVVFCALFSILGVDVLLLLLAGVLLECGGDFKVVCTNFGFAGVVWFWDDDFDGVF